MATNDIVIFLAKFVWRNVNQFFWQKTWQTDEAATSEASSVTLPLAML